VLWRRAGGVVVPLMIALLQIYDRVCQRKTCENRSIVNKVETFLTVQNFTGLSVYTRRQLLWDTVYTLSSVMFCIGAAKHANRGLNQTGGSTSMIKFFEKWYNLLSVNAMLPSIFGT